MRKELTIAQEDALRKVFEEAHKKGAERHGGLWLLATSHVLSGMARLTSKTKVEVQKEDLLTKTILSLTILRTLDAVKIGQDAALAQAMYPAKVRTANTKVVTPYLTLEVLKHGPDKLRCNDANDPRAWNAGDNIVEAIGGWMLAHGADYDIEIVDKTQPAPAPSPETAAPLSKECQEK